MKHHGPFRITELIGQIAVRLELPSNIAFHPLIHVEHTKPARTQPANVSVPAIPPSLPFFYERGNTAQEVGEILAHRQRGGGFRFPLLYKGAPRHEAE